MNKNLVIGWQHDCYERLLTRTLFLLARYDYFNFVICTVAIMTSHSTLHFQITTKRINFIAENVETSSSGTELDHSYEDRDQEKNRSWLISSLHQIYSRRLVIKMFLVNLIKLLSYMLGSSSICLLL